PRCRRDDRQILARPRRRRIGCPEKRFDQGVGRRRRGGLGGVAAQDMAEPRSLRDARRGRSRQKLGRNAAYRGGLIVGVVLERRKGNELVLVPRRRDRRRHFGNGSLRLGEMIERSFGEARRGRSVGAPFVGGFCGVPRIERLLPLLLIVRRRVSEGIFALL